VYIPELFELTWKSTHVERIASTHRFQTENAAPVGSPSRWMMRVLRKVRKSHGQPRLEACAISEAAAAATATGSAT